MKTWSGFLRSKSKVKGKETKGKISKAVKKNKNWEWWECSCFFSVLEELFLSHDIHVM